MREALLLESSPSSPLTTAAAPFRRASQWITGTGTVSPEIGKLLTALVVSAAHSCCLLGIRALLFADGRRWTLSAEGQDLPRQPHGIVVGHQESRARKHAQLAVGKQRERLFGPGQRIQRVL